MLRITFVWIRMTNPDVVRDTWNMILGVLYFVYEFMLDLWDPITPDFTRPQRRSQTLFTRLWLGALHFTVRSALILILNEAFNDLDVPLVLEFWQSILIEYLTSIMVGVVFVYGRGYVYMSRRGKARIYGFSLSFAITHCLGQRFSTFMTYVIFSRAFHGLLYMLVVSFGGIPVTYVPGGVAGGVGPGGGGPGGGGPGGGGPGGGPGGGGPGWPPTNMPTGGWFALAQYLLANNDSDSNHGSNTSVSSHPNSSPAHYSSSSESVSDGGSGAGDGTLAQSQESLVHDVNSGTLGIFPGPPSDHSGISGIGSQEDEEEAEEKDHQKDGISDHDPGNEAEVSSTTSDPAVSPQLNAKDGSSDDRTANDASNTNPTITVAQKKSGPEF